MLSLLHSSSGTFTASTVNAVGRRAFFIFGARLSVEAVRLLFISAYFSLCGAAGLCS